MVYITDTHSISFIYIRLSKINKGSYIYYCYMYMHTATTCTMYYYNYMHVLVH